MGLDKYPIPYWAEKAYLIGIAVYARAESEMHDGDDDSDDIIGGGGKNTGMQFTGKGDSDTFRLINEHLQELSNRNT